MPAEIAPTVWPSHSPIVGNVGLATEIIEKRFKVTLPTLTRFSQPCQLIEMVETEFGACRLKAGALGGPRPDRTPVVLQTAHNTCNIIRFTWALKFGRSTGRFHGDAIRCLG